MKDFFFDIKTTIKIKLDSILEKFTQCRNRREQADLHDCDNDTCTSTQFVRIQKKQLFDMQEHLECFFNALPVFGFNSEKKISQANKTLFISHSCYRTQHWTYCYKKIEPVCLVQILWCSAVGYEKVSWRRNKSWFHLEGIQNFGDQKFFPYEWFDNPDKMPKKIACMMLSTVNFAAVTLLKPNTRTTLSCWKQD